MRKASRYVHQRIRSDRSNSQSNDQYLWMGPEEAA